MIIFFKHEEFLSSIFPEIIFQLMFLQEKYLVNWVVLPTRRKLFMIVFIQRCWKSCNFLSFLIFVIFGLLFFGLVDFRGLSILLISLKDQKHLDLLISITFEILFSFLHILGLRYYTFLNT